MGYATRRYVLWLDGGDTTGWALFDQDVEQIVHDQLDQFDVLGRRLKAWLSTAGPDTVLGAERYVVTTLSAQKDPTLIAAQVYGMARWLAVEYGAEWVGSQTSSDALSVVTDQWLRAFDWFQVGLPHANDAARHVVKYLLDHGGLSTAMTKQLSALLR